MSSGVAWTVRRSVTGTAGPGPAGRPARTVPPGGLHLWAVRTDRWPDDPRDLYAVLDDAERRRADAFVFPRDRQWYVISHAFLRRVLSWYVARPPDALRFTAGAYGKPRLDGPGASPRPEFNLSHCPGLALVGVATEPVGVDVEAVRAGAPETGVADYFHPAERRALAALPADRRRAAFYRCWTRKEAVVKAIGTGMSVGLDSFQVAVDLDVPTVALGRGAHFPARRPWCLLHLEPAVGFIGAACLPVPPGPVTATLLTGPVLAV
ncbi:4'-phosphopantetheinyl transferase [Streptomyces sp. NBRC 110611]|nr:4'-phosphopantetheinyl transferase [Streptomyces sp. NBRC 110611]